MQELIYKAEVYAIVGACFRIQNHFGFGFSEIVYKDALELELNENDLTFEREKEFHIIYMGQRLKHRFFADFCILDKIIVEIKSTKEGISREYVSQTLNYLKVSGCKLGLLVNFGKSN